MPYRIRIPYREKPITVHADTADEALALCVLLSKNGHPAEAPAEAPETPEEPVREPEAARAEEPPPAEPRRGRYYLTAEQHHEIRRRALAGEKDRALAEEFGCSESTVWLIRHGKTRPRSSGSSSSSESEKPEAGAGVVGPVKIPGPGELLPRQIREIRKQLGAGFTVEAVANRMGLPVKAVDGAVVVR